MKTIVNIIIISFLIGFSVNLFAHEAHHTDNDTLQKSAVMADSAMNTNHASNAPKPTTFSTLHPLVVHFPIVLLIIAALLQLIGLFYTKNNWDYITLFLLAGGALGAFLSGSYFHPHTEGLTHQANEILERHELFASLTLFSAIAALLLKIVGMFIFKTRKQVLEVITVFVLLFSAVSVSLAGHWGAYLTHVEGIGPQGKYIDNDE